jgi:hypothetical protein
VAERNLTLLRGTYNQQFPLNLPVYATDIPQDGMDNVLVVDNTRWDVPYVISHILLESIEK